MLTARKALAFLIGSFALITATGILAGCETKGVHANQEWTTAIDKGAAWQTEFSTRMEAKAKAAESGTMSEADKTAALRFAADGTKVQADQWTKVQQAVHGIYPTTTNTTTQPAN